MISEIMECGSASFVMIDFFFEVEFLFFKFGDANDIRRGVFHF